MTCFSEAACISTSFGLALWMVPRQVLVPMMMMMMMMMMMIRAMRCHDCSGSVDRNYLMALIFELLPYRFFARLFQDPHPGGPFLDTTLFYKFLAFSRW